MNKINHPLLGGDLVDRDYERNKIKKMPQRKPEKYQTGEELLNKACYGTPKKASSAEIANREWQKLI